MSHTSSRNRSFLTNTFRWWNNLHKRRCAADRPTGGPADRPIRLEMFHRHLHGYIIIILSSLFYLFPSPISSIPLPLSFFGDRYKQYSKDLYSISFIIQQFLCLFTNLSLSLSSATMVYQPCYHNFFI